MASYLNPEDEQDVYVYTDLSTTCWNCDDKSEFEDAELAGDQHQVSFAWTCPNCGYENTVELDPRDYL